jgi:hypothetical protein
MHEQGIHEASAIGSAADTCCVWNSYRCVLRRTHVISNVLGDRNSSSV